VNSFRVFNNENTRKINIDAYYLITYNLRRIICLDRIMISMIV